MVLTIAYKKSWFIASGWLVDSIFIHSVIVVSTPLVIILIMSIVVAVVLTFLLDCLCLVYCMVSNSSLYILDAFSCGVLGCSTNSTPLWLDIVGIVGTIYSQVRFKSLTYITEVSRYHLLNVIWIYCIQINKYSVQLLLQFKCYLYVQFCYQPKWHFSIWVPIFHMLVHKRTL